jgi:hypothetical protein
VLDLPKGVADERGETRLDEEGRAEDNYQDHLDQNQKYNS